MLVSRNNQALFRENSRIMSCNEAVAFLCLSGWSSKATVSDPRFRQPNHCARQRVRVHPTLPLNSHHLSSRESPHSLCRCLTSISEPIAFFSYIHFSSGLLCDLLFTLCLFTVFYIRPGVILLKSISKNPSKVYHEVPTRVVSRCLRRRARRSCQYRCQSTSSIPLFGWMSINHLLASSASSEHRYQDGYGLLDSDCYCS